MKTTNKLNNAITINFDNDMMQLINKLAKTYQRKTAEYLRLLITPVLINEYAKMQALKHNDNVQPLTPAIFND